MIISRTPYRVSFFGGGTDYPVWYREHGGAVLSTTIDKYCYISIRELPPFFDHRYRVVYSIVENVQEISEIKHPAVRAILEWLDVRRGVEIHHDGDLPARSGVGSSSAFTVGLLSAVHALEGQYTSKDALAQEAIHVEQCLLREAVGLQDQVSAAFGGFNHVTIRPDGAFQVNPVVIPHGRVDDLQGHLLLLFTGIARTAAEVAQTMLDNVGNREAELHALQQMVDRAIEILTSATTDLKEFGHLLHESWILKRELSPRVSNSTIDGLYERARRAGAVGGKLLGAGGGGFMLLFVPPGDRANVAAALGDMIRVPFKFDASGSRVVLYQPDGW